MFINGYFWLSLCLCLVGYFILRFGQKSRGSKRVQIESFGGLILFISFPLVFVTVGWKAFFVLIGAFWIVVTPVVEVLISSLWKGTSEIGSKPLTETGKEGLFEHLKATGQIRDKDLQ